MENVDELEQLNGTLTQWINEERFEHFPKITRANINQMLQTRKFLVLVVVEENKLNELVSHEHDFREMMENFTHKHYDRYHNRFQFGWVSDNTPVFFFFINIYFTLTCLRSSFDRSAAPSWPTRSPWTTCRRLICWC